MENCPDFVEWTAAWAHPYPSPIYKEQPIRNKEDFFLVENNHIKPGGPLALTPNDHTKTGHSFDVQGKSFRQKRGEKEATG